MTITHEDLLSQQRPGVLRFGGARMSLLDIEAGFWGLRRQMEALVGEGLTDNVLQQAGANGGASFARAFVGQKNDEQALRDCVASYQAAGFGQFDVEVVEWPLGRVLVRGRDAFESWMVQQQGRSTSSPVCAYSSGVLLGFVNVLAGRSDVVCVERTCQAQGAEACLFELLPASESDVPVVALDPDPALGRQINLLEILFERMPMGIVILDRDLRLRRFNPTWAEFISRYTSAAPGSIVPGVSFFDLARGMEDNTRSVFERALQGETVRQDAFRLVADDMVSYWDAVTHPLTENGRVVGIVHVTTDVTERERVREELEQRVQERTRELRTLLQVSHDVNSTLKLQPLLDLVLEQLKIVVDYVGASILTLEENELAVRAYRGPIAAETARQLRFPLGEALVNREVIERREPLIIADVQGTSRMARLFRQTAGGQLETVFGYVRSWLGVPLMVKGDMLGMLTLDHSEPGFFTPQHGSLVLAFANQVAVAIENARLYEQAQEAAVAAERNRLARDLHDAVTQTLFSASLIAEVLPRIWEVDEEEGRRRLDELRELTRGALAEMRTLLLELRPWGLQEARLSDLLRQLGASVTGRTRVPVALELDGECDLDPDVKVALYRIAQEALNNVAKHADATQATVLLRCRPPGPETDGRDAVVELCVGDDGTGFDASTVAANSLGLGIMRERAEAIGAALTVESQVGAGTTISVVWRGSVP